LNHFLENGSGERALRKDGELNHIHWATNRRRDIPGLIALAIDHRSQLEDLAGGDAKLLARIPAFKALAVRAAAQVANGRDGFGMLLDDKYGREALYAAGGQPNFWIGRPIELPGSRPLQFEFSQDLGSRLIDWPVDHCIKVLCFYHPDDPAELRLVQMEKLRTAHDAARKVGRDLLIEIIAGKHGALGEDTVARALGQIYDAGIRPDWWKLEPQASPAAWAAIDTAIETRDPYCRGVVLLGLDAPMSELKAGFAVARKARSVRGFAVGRSIFGQAASAWLAGEIDDAAAVAEMARRFGWLVEVWEAA
jgi:5-dehydro-2-deoxygluconokinase